MVVRGLTPGDLVEISIGTSAADTERRAISQVDGSGSAQAQLLAPAARPQPWQVTVVRLGLARIRPVLATFAVRLAAAAVPASQVDLGYVAPRWFVDGMGEFAAYDALLSERMITADLVARYLEDSRANKPVPLRTLEGPSWPAEGNPYGLAHAAVARLAMTSGTSGLASFCSAIGTGAGWQQAFQKAFATGVPDFYSAFDRWTGSGRWD